MLAGAKKKQENGDGRMEVMEKLATLLMLISHPPLLLVILDAQNVS